MRQLPNSPGAGPQDFLGRGFPQFSLLSLADTFLFYLAFSLVTLALGTLSTPTLSAQEKNSDLLGELEENVSRRIEEAEASVVAIVRVSKNTLEDPTSPDFVPRNFGTGVAISTDGLILTCYHLLGNPAENNYYVWKNGVSFRVRKAEKVEAVIGADP